MNNIYDKLNFNYAIFLTLASNMDLPENIEKLLLPSIKIFNETCCKSLVNVKQIKSIKKINNKILKLELYSDKEIKVPGKAMRHFSSILMENHLLDHCMHGNKLFKQLNIDAIEKENKNFEIIDPNGISDIDFINQLNKYIYQKTSIYSKDGRIKEKTLDDIKILAIKFGLVKI